ncbi:hypothetical protein AB0L06_30880 [Spirillospora sp. NPDC052269]
MRALRQRDESSGRYWRLRTRLEVMKAVAWAVIEWMRFGDPSGPWL